MEPEQLDRNSLDVASIVSEMKRKLKGRSLSVVESAISIEDSRLPSIKKNLVSALTWTCDELKATLLKAGLK
jgi:hypothetical protein